MTHDTWPEVTEAELQDWLDTKSPDYIIEHPWQDDRIDTECLDRRTRLRFAFQGHDKRCYVHPDYFRQVRPE